ncbi:hypothetical protein C0416_01830 [bacterium]|nr:hypothetical protein [bacterium]
MPFAEGRKMISESLDPQKIKIEKKQDVEKLKHILGNHAFVAEYTIKSLTYPDKEKDKKDFLSQLRAEIHEIAKDNLAESKELVPLAEKLEERSKILRQNFLEKQKKFDTEKYQAAVIKVEEDLSSAKFTDAHAKLNAVSTSLSPLSRTAIEGYHISSRYNLEEADVRLDIKIREQKIKIDESKQVYEKLIQQGQVIKGREGNNYISKKENGMIALTKVQIDPETGAKVSVWTGQKENINWLSLWSEIQQNDYKVKQLEANKDPKTGEYVANEKDIVIKTSEEDINLSKEKARIAEIKALKQINQLYLFKNEAMQNLPKDKKELLEKAFEENLMNLTIYFEKYLTSTGPSIRPTEAYLYAGKYLKQQILQQMISGASTILQRLQIENKLNEKGVDPEIQPYYKAEVLMSKGLYIKANFYYRKFLEKNAGNTDGKFNQEVNNAKQQIKITAFKLLDFAKRHLIAVSSHLTKKEYSVGLAMIEGAEQDLQNNPDTYDFTKAVFKQVNILKELSGVGDDGLKANRRDATAFVLSLGKAITADSAEGVMENILKLGKESRKADFPEAAAVVFKEVMDEDVKEHKNAFAKQNPEIYREKLAEIQKTAGSDIELLRSARKYTEKVCGEEFKTMSIDEQREQILYYSNLFLNQKIESEMNQFVTKDYLNKTKGKNNEAAQQYVDMYNYFDSNMPWKWSDKAWNTITDEIVINGTMLALSGGVGNVVGNLTKAGLLKIAGSKLPSILTGLTAFTAETGAFTLTHAGLSTAIQGAEGQFKWENLKKSFIHNFALLGTMNLGSKLLRPQLMKLTPYKNISPQDLTILQKLAQGSTAKTLSVTAVEAPIMAAFSTLMPIFENDQNQKISFANFGRHYLQSLRDIAFISAGHKLTGAMTGGFLPKLSRRLELKAQSIELESNFVKLQSSKNPADLAKANILETLLKENKLSPEATLKIAKSELRKEDIAKLAKFMQNPVNADLLTMYEAARRSEDGGKEKTGALERVRQSLVENMQKLGIKGTEIFKILGTISERGLSDLKIGSQMTMQSAKEYLTKNTQKISKLLEIPKYKAAWQLFVKDCEGSYETFMQKHPKIANSLPPTLKEAMQKVTVVGVAALTGMPVMIGNIESVQNKAVQEKNIEIAMNAIKNGDYVDKVITQLSKKELKVLSENSEVMQMLSDNIAEWANLVDVKNACNMFKPYVNLEAKFLAKKKQQYEEIFAEGSSLQGLILTLELKKVFPNFDLDYRSKITLDKIPVIIQSSFDRGFSKNVLQQLSDSFQTFGISKREMIEMAGNAIRGKLTKEIESVVKYKDMRSAEDIVNLFEKSGNFYEAFGDPGGHAKHFVDAARILYQKGKPYLAVALSERYGAITLNDSEVLKNPFEGKDPSIEKVYFMSKAWEAFNKISIKDKQKLDPSKLQQKMISLMKSENSYALTLKQRKLINDFLTKYKKHQGISEVVKGLPQDKQRLWLNKAMQDIRGVMFETGNFEFDLKVVENANAGPKMNFYVPKEIFTQYYQDIANMKTLSEQQRQTLIQNTTAGGWNVDILDGLVNIIPNNSKTPSQQLELHEGAHGFTKMFGIRSRYSDMQIDWNPKTLKDAKLNMVRAYQRELQYMSDEIISFTKDGSLAHDGVEFLFKTLKTKYFANPSGAEIYSLDSMKDGAVKEKVRAFKSKVNADFEVAVLAAIRNAETIYQHPEGFNMMRIANVKEWGKVAFYLQNKGAVDTAVNKLRSENVLGPEESGIELLKYDAVVKLKEKEPFSHVLTIKGKTLGFDVNGKLKVYENEQALSMEKLMVEAESVRYKTVNETLDILGVKGEHRELVRETYFDSASGLMNRNGLALGEKLLLEGKKMSIANFDADHFKASNELKSREYGDAQIKIIAKNINQAVMELRAAGYKAYGVRMGGEEFTIMSTAPQGVLHKKMLEMSARSKQETLSTLSAVDKENMAGHIKKTKYGDNPSGVEKAMSELGGISGSVIGIDGKVLKKDQKGNMEKSLMYADKEMERLKNENSGRGNFNLDKKSPQDTSKEINGFKIHNVLNDTQKGNLNIEVKRLAVNVDKQFNSRLELTNSVINGVDASKRKAFGYELKRVLSSPDSTIEDIGKVLKNYGAEVSLAGRLQSEYVSNLRDHGTYTGANTMGSYQKEILRPKGRFEAKNSWELEVGKFKSINETLGHVGGDMYLTFVYQDVILSTAKDLGIKVGAKERNVVIAQKGANFRFCFSTEFMAKNPGIEAKFQAALNAKYQIQYKALISKLNKESGKDYQQERDAWLKKNEASNPNSMTQQYNLSFNKS